MGTRGPTVLNRADVSGALSSSQYSTIPPVPGAVDSKDDTKINSVVALDADVATNRTDLPYHEWRCGASIAWSNEKEVRNHLV